MFKRQLVLLAVILLGLMLVSCAKAGGENLEATAVPPVEPPTPQEVLAARRAVLDFLRVGAITCVPPRGAIWKTLPGEAPQGFDVFRFDSEGCSMTISYPLPETTETLYHVTLHNSVLGFCWQANVDAEGEIVTTGTEAGLLPELSNAAAAFCEEQGHTYEVQDQSDGQRCGQCVFEDGESCNAWAYFQGMCEE